MESQVTVRLPEDLRLALEEASRRTHRKTSEIVRMALRQYLEREMAEERPIDRIRDLIGSVESGRPDLARNHRKYVLESLRRGR